MVKRSTKNRTEVKFEDKIQSLTFTNFFTPNIEKEHPVSIYSNKSIKAFDSEIKKLTKKNQK